MSISFDAVCQVELFQLSQRRALDVREPCHATQPEQGFRIRTLERLDRHRQNSNAIRY